MTEDYLHYIWKFGLYTTISLETTLNESVQILFQGTHNFNSGPDFLEGRVVIDQTTWAGNIEIHINTSDWTKHKHQNDKAYNNVILHVVYNHDKEIYNQNGETIPTLELKDLINHENYFSYERFLTTQNWIPCEKLLPNIADVKINSMLDRTLLNRMERKSLQVFEELRETNGNWDEVFYRFLFRYFGMKVNGLAMFDLAKRTPFKLIQKESKECFALEALLFGQAGMLNSESNDIHHSNLREEYLYQEQKHSLISMNKVQWKYSRLRPPNFPTIRIAQLAMLYATNSRIFQLVRDKESIELIKSVLRITTSVYWESHYNFGKTSENAKCTVGDMLLNNLVINVIAPVCFAYGKSISDYSYVDYSFQLLRNLKSEKNKITTNWLKIGVGCESSFDSQALIELNEEFCSQKKCLNCSLGVEILSKEL